MRAGPENILTPSRKYFFPNLDLIDRITAVIQWEADLKFTNVLWYLDKVNVFC